MLRPSVALAALTAVLGLGLAGCSGDDSEEPAVRNTATTAATSPSPEDTAVAIPQGSGTGDVIGSIGEIAPDDDWQVTCSDVGGGSVLLNAVGSAPNTIQATVKGTAVEKLTISYDELLVSVPDGKGLTVKQVADGYAFAGSVDVPGSGSQTLTLELDCGA